MKAMNSRSALRRYCTRILTASRSEPLEEVSCEVPQEFVGSVIEKLGARKGEMKDMVPHGDRMNVVFHIPTRGLFVTATNS